MSMSICPDRDGEGRWKRPAPSVSWVTLPSFCQRMLVGRHGR